MPGKKVILPRLGVIICAQWTYLYSGQRLDIKSMSPRERVGSASVVTYTGLAATPCKPGVALYVGAGSEDSGHSNWSSYLAPAWRLLIDNDFGKYLPDLVYVWRNKYSNKFLRWSGVIFQQCEGTWDHDEKCSHGGNLLKWTSASRYITFRKANWGLFSSVLPWFVLLSWGEYARYERWAYPMRCSGKIGWYFSN